MKNNTDGRNDYNSDEEQTYNNLESIQLFMKKKDGDEADSEIEKSIEDEEDYITPEPEPEKLKKKIVKKLKKQESDYDESEPNYDEDEDDEDFDEDSESSLHFTKKKRGRDGKKKKGKAKPQKKKKKGVSDFLELEASSDDSEVSDDEGAEITDKQRKQLMEQHLKRDNQPDRRRNIMNYAYLFLI
jgi:hypothetical protein